MESNKYDEALQFIKAVEVVARAYGIEVNSVLSTLSLFCDESKDKIRTSGLIALHNDFVQMDIKDRAIALGLKTEKVK